MKRYLGAEEEGERHAVAVGAQRERQYLWLPEVLLVILCYAVGQER